MPKIMTCLWFNNNAEEAARFYTSVFKNSRIGRIARYTDTGHELHRARVGTVMTIEFELDGHPFLALNGGPMFKFTEAVSFPVLCETQDEVDYYWSRLSEGGDPEAQRCGWLKDRYGLSWQIVPNVVLEMLTDTNADRANRVLIALMAMNKLDIKALKRAYDQR